MSHFYGSLSSSMAKTERTIRGGKPNGIKAHIRGWSSGVFVETLHIEGFDVFKIYETDGSNGNNKLRLIDTIKKKVENV